VAILLQENEAAGLGNLLKPGTIGIEVEDEGKLLTEDETSLETDM